MNDREARHAELAARFLPSPFLDRIRERAADHDRENTFFDADLEELREGGYLTALVPEPFGGAGLTLNEMQRLQQRLAGAGPATALAINMHLLCLGVARTLHLRGDHSLDGVFTEAMAGEIFAFGISEPGNDWVLQGARTEAVPQADGSYLLSGVKIFTSLSPVWTRLIVHGLDTSRPESPELVYGFLERGADREESERISVSDDWNVLGMRASHSRTTKLNQALLRADRVVRRLPPGQHPDPLVFAITSNFQLLVGSVYAGIAARALEVAAEGLRNRKSEKAGASLAEVPEFRARIADAHLAYLPVPAQLDAYSRDLDELVDHGSGWPLRLVSARLNAGSAARACAETALVCAGGAGYGAAHEASRLYRDAAASLFHPPSPDAARPLFAAALLDE